MEGRERRGRKEREKSSDREKEGERKGVAFGRSLSVSVYGDVSGGS